MKKYVCASLVMLVCGVVLADEADYYRELENFEKEQQDRQRREALGLGPRIRIQGRYDEETRRMIREERERMRRASPVHPPEQGWVYGPRGWERAE